VKERYHVMLGERRTTVCLDTTLSVLMGLYLGVEPGSLEAHSAIRRWMQEKIDSSDDPGRIRVSQWLQREIVEELISKELAENYNAWLLKEG
jgi:hypothetical protein